MWSIAREGARALATLCLAAGPIVTAVGLFGTAGPASAAERPGGFRVVQPSGSNVGFTIVNPDGARRSGGFEIVRPGSDARIPEPPRSQTAVRTEPRPPAPRPTAVTAPDASAPPVVALRPEPPRPAPEPTPRPPVAATVPSAAAAAAAVPTAPLLATPAAQTPSGPSSPARTTAEVPTTREPSAATQPAPVAAETPPAAAANREESDTVAAEGAPAASTAKTGHEDPSAVVRTNDSVAMVRVGDLLMKEARLRAKGTLDDFLAIATKPPEGARNFLVKVALKNEDSVENIWVGALERRVRKKMFITVSERWSGRLANQPIGQSGRKQGDKVNFTRDDIVDWMYFDPSGRMIGNTSACAVAAREGGGRLDDLKRRFGLDCRWVGEVTTATAR
jgi:uncharacterized protein YegJ (DUF2314 family)